MDKKVEVDPRDATGACDKTTKPAQVLSPAAQRALDEAAERRRNGTYGQGTREIGGRGGLEPVRYNDWEIKGLASDF